MAASLPSASMKAFEGMTAPERADADLKGVVVLAIMQGGDINAAAVGVWLEPLRQASVAPVDDVIGSVAARGEK